MATGGDEPVTVGEAAPREEGRAPIYRICQLAWREVSGCSPASSWGAHGRRGGSRGHGVRSQGLRSAAAPGAAGLGSQQQRFPAGPRPRRRRRVLCSVVTAGPPAGSVGRVSTFPNGCHRRLRFPRTSRVTGFGRYPGRLGRCGKPGGSGPGTPTPAGWGAGGRAGGAGGPCVGAAAGYGGACGAAHGGPGSRACASGAARGAARRVPRPLVGSPGPAADVYKSLELAAWPWVTVL